jgi:hypothetical protein
MPLKLYIIGAGVSAGATDGAPTASPVANDLFNEEYARFADRVGISKPDFESYRLAAKQNGNLEDYLTKLWDDIPNKASLVNQQSIRAEFGRIMLYVYLLFQEISFSINPSDNLYLDFAKLLKAKDEDFAIINFNYDTLLDSALTKVFPFHLQNEISKYYDVNYLKPHGSVNWFIDPGDSSIRKHNDHDVLVNYVSGSAYNTSFPAQVFRIYPPKLEGMQNLSFLWNSDFKPYGIPLVLVPLATKLYDLQEKLYKGIVNKAIEIGPNINEVTILGYQAKDEIIKTLLSKIPDNTPLNVFSLNSSKEIAERLSSNGNISKLAINEVNDIDFKNYLSIEKSKINH